MAGHVRIEPDPRSFRAVARALQDEADGQQLKADLVAGLRGILEEVRSEQRAGLMSSASGGMPTGGEPLREAVSDRLRTTVRIGPTYAGARVSAGRTGMPRGFRNAPKRLNAHQWRHKIFGRDVWVTQLSPAEDWFDNPIDRHGARFRAAARRELEKVALRIDRKT